VVRRIVISTAVMVLVVSAAAWMVSFFSVTWLEPGFPALRVSLSRGVLWIHNQGAMGPSAVSGWRVHGWDWSLRWWHGGLGFVEWTRGKDGVPFFGLLVPLWMPAAAAALVLACTWFVGRSSRRNAGAGLCPTCAYDLTGITGPCPECGHNP
jgi:hypothetical protein